MGNVQAQEYPGELWGGELWGALHADHGDHAMYASLPFAAVATGMPISAWSAAEDNSDNEAGLIQQSISRQLQRAQIGCFEEEPPSCDYDYKAALQADGGPEVDANAVCRTLQFQYIPFAQINNHSHHVDYLSSILVDDTELCRQVRIAYPQCWWCGHTKRINDLTDNFCWRDILTTCEGPSLENVTQSRPDINVEESCAALQAIYDTPGPQNVQVPFTFDLCEKERLLYHHCPQSKCNDNSTNGCFDDANPPSCTAANSTVDSSSEEDEEPIEMGLVEVNNRCQALFYMLPFWDPEKLLDTSIHADHLNQHLLKRLNVTANSTQCDRFQHAYSRCFWCDPQLTVDTVHDNCDAVPVCDMMMTNTTNASITSVAATPWTPQLQQDLDAANATCQELSELKAFNARPFTADLCPRVSAAQDLLCPEILCGEEFRMNRTYIDLGPKNVTISYLGATTKNQKRALVWTSRFSAILSFGGALFILWDILRHPKARVNVYHQLLIGMALSDICTAVAWSFATAPIPTSSSSSVINDPNYGDDPKPYVDYIYGSMGNEATCTAQAFFVQLGFTSVFYNVSLAVYYLLVINYDWRESKLKAIRIYLHGLPCLVGLGLAFGGLPLYHWIEYGCHIVPPPTGYLWVALVFVFIPIASSIAAITTAMLLIYCKIHKQAKNSPAVLGHSSQNGIHRLVKDVFWQSVWYALAFYITWPIMFSVYLQSSDVGGPYGFAVTVAFVAPLQGALNALVYIRPKINRYLRNRARQASSSREGSRSKKASGDKGSSSNFGVVGTGNGQRPGPNDRRLRKSLNRSWRSTFLGMEVENSSRGFRQRQADIPQDSSPWAEKDIAAKKLESSSPQKREEALEGLGTGFEPLEVVSEVHGTDEEADREEADAQEEADVSESSDAVDPSVLLALQELPDPSRPSPERTGMNGKCSQETVLSVVAENAEIEA